MNGDLVATGYDALYDALPNSPALSRIWNALACGPDYPTAYGNISFVTLDEMRSMDSHLDLGEGLLVVDLACGSGGPGLWIATEGNARLAGVDISRAGIAQARRRATELGVLGRTTFFVGSFAAVAMRSGAASGAMSVDAIQYAPDKRAAFTEAARLLRTGARLVFTAFEVIPSRVKGIPILGDDPVDDYGPLLYDSGFAIERYEETEGWRDRLTTTYQAVLGARDVLERELGAGAFAALELEVSLTLELDPYRRRVFAVARRL